MKKRFVSALLAMLMVVTLVPVTAFGATIVAEGYCGGDTTAEYDSASGAYKNLPWTLDSAGTLTISGTGPMAEYCFSPWYMWFEETIKAVIISGATTISAQAFQNCRELESVIISDSVTTIGDYAFNDCIALTKITIPNSVTTIGNDAFKGCKSLQSATIGNGVTAIGYEVFQDCKNLQSVTIGRGVTAIRDYAFRRCSALTSVTLPDSVRTIGKSAFYSCYALQSAELGKGVTSIGVSAFQYCSSLKEITIPDGVTTLERSVFSDCSSLKRVTLGKSVTTVGEEAFNCCHALTSVTLPDSVTSIGNDAFVCCDALQSAELGKGVTSIGYRAFGLCHALTSVTLPDSVTSIGALAFCYCTSLAEVVISHSVTTIADSTFSNCALTKVTIPVGVTTIGDSAFSNCPLTKVTIPVSVTTIGKKAFGNNSYLNDIYYAGSAAKWNEIYIGDSNFNDIYGNFIATIHYNYVPESQQRGMINGMEYYSTTEERLFRVLDKNSGYYSPAGFTVHIGSEQFTSGNETCCGSDDITAFIPADYSGNVTITRPGYHTCTFPAYLTAQSNYVVMVPSTETKPFPQTFLLIKSRGVYANYVNLLWEQSTQYEADPFGDNGRKLISLYPAMNWNGHGAGQLWLVQGEKSFELTDGQENVIDWYSCYFVAGEPIYLVAKAADGTTTSICANINVYKAPTSGVNIDLGESLSVDTSQSTEGDLSIIAGNSLKIDFKNLSDGLLPINFTVKSDGTIEGVIGLQLGKYSDTEAVFGEMKNSIDRLEKVKTDKARETAQLLREMKQYGMPVPKSSEFGVAGSITILGYFTGKISDGGVKLTDTKIVGCFDGKFSYTYNTVVWVVPAYFKVTLSGKIENYLKMSYDEALKKLVPDNINHLDASISVAAETGPGWSGYLSGGVKGTGVVKMKGQFPLSTPTTSFSVQALFSFVGTLLGIEGEWVFYQTPEKVFWNAGDFCWEDAAKTNAAQSFVPNLRMTEMTMLGAPNAIATGVSGYTSPTLAQLSNGRLLAVWVTSVPGRSAVDKNGVWYSIFDGSTWSQAQLVCDDGTNDSVPQLYSNNRTVYLAWQNYTTTFDTDELPDYDTLSAQMVTVVAGFDESESTWDTPTQTEPDWYQSEPTLPEDYEGKWPDSFGVRSVLTYGDNRAVLYLANDENECAQVFGLFHDGYNWGQPLQLTAVSGGIDGFSAVMGEDSMQILYTSGDYADAALSMAEVDLQADMVVRDVDYVRQTFVPENELTLVTTVKNESPVTVNGVHVRVLNGGTEVHSEDISVRFDSGEEDILYVNYTLPETIDFSQLTVEVTPLNGDDASPSDNAGVCALYSVDLSAENPSAQMFGGITKVLTQVVNRGRERTAATTLTLYKDTPDGEILATQEIPAMDPGELRNIAVELDSLAPDEMVYMAIAECGKENLIGNNTTQAVVLAEKVKEYDTGDCNGDDDVDVTDMACLYTWLSTGKNEGSLDTKAFQKIADINGDSVINILDYQALYELIKQHP